MKKYQVLITKKLEDGAIQLRGHYYESIKELKMSVKYYRELFSNEANVTVEGYKRTQDNIWDEIEI